MTIADRIHISKRSNASNASMALTNVIAIVAALVASGLIMLIMGFNPFAVYGNIVTSSMSSAFSVRETLNTTILLTILSLGISVAFRMKFWNIGAEGQLYMGAFGATLMAFSFPDLPAGVLLPLMGLAGFVFGGIWALIPALIKVKFSTSETLVTLMMNYIAIAFIEYLEAGPWKDPAALGANKIARFAGNAVLPRVFGVHAGWIVTLVLVVVMAIMMKYSKIGYQIDVLGESETTARYAGMNTLKITLIAVLVSGGLCGIGGFMQASAVEKSLTAQLSGGLGFTAVITAWLAKLKPPVMVVVSFVFAMLLNSQSSLQSMGMPAAMAGILQGMIIFFVLGSEFFINYRISLRKTEKEG
ncbi:nucleoside ABC transporter membrane protein [Eubacterium sp. CAG:786]|nr:nucleoside ABC transporter membrane protein [Eubacterium sp. CAG:786]